MKGTNPMRNFVDFRGNVLRTGNLVNYKGHLYTITRLDTRKNKARLINSNRTLTLTAGKLALSDRIN